MSKRFIFSEDCDCIFDTVTQDTFDYSELEELLNFYDNCVDNLGNEVERLKEELRLALN